MDDNQNKTDGESECSHYFDETGIGGVERRGSAGWVKTIVSVERQSQAQADSRSPSSRKIVPPNERKTPAMNCQDRGQYHRTPSWDRETEQPTAFAN